MEEPIEKQPAANGANGVQLPHGGPVQINVEAARAPELLTTDEIKANTDQLGVILSSPAVLQAVGGLVQWLQTKAALDIESAKAQATSAQETEKERLTNSEHTAKLNASVASQFLRNLLVLGLAAIGLLGLMAWTKIVDGQVFSVLATVIITSVFGGTIYGTTLRPKDKN